MSDADPDANNTTNQTDASELPTHDRKRRRETDDSPQSSKCKKNANEASDSSTEQNALLDLNIDCLEHIFGYLNYDDLINVADLDGNARTAAQLIFSRRYSNFPVKMYTYCKDRSDEITRPAIVLSKVSECAKILRNFGKCIKRLELNDFTDLKMSRNRIAIKNLIDKNCTKTLVELTLYKCDQQLSDGFENVFENVEKLRVQSTSLGKWKELNKWFPKLKRLELFEPMQIITRIPRVTRSSSSLIELIELSESDVKAMIKSAPQLHTLALTGHMNANYLRFINDNLPMLKRLILPDFKFVENPTETNVFFENVESFSIMDKRIPINGTLHIPFKFKQLKELDIDATMSYRTPVKWIDFAIQQRDIIKLRFRSYPYYWPTFLHRQVNEIAAKLTKLTDFYIYIGYNWVPLSLVIALLNCQSLTKLEIRSLPPIDGNRAVALATGKWILFQNNQQVVFTRETDN